MPKETINWKIAGAAGAGIKSSGEMMAKAMNRLGYWVYGYTEYPSLIRGGHNIYQVHAGAEPVYAAKKRLDVLLALNEESVAMHADELDEKSMVIVDKGAEIETKVNAKIVDVELLETAKNLGNPLFMNMVGLGVSAAALGLPSEEFVKLIKDTFADKPDLLEKDVEAFLAGYQMIKAEKHMDVEKGKQKLLMSGSEAVGLGAISSGLQYYAAYPMTPSTPVLHFLAARAHDFGYVVRQTEDEISAANMIVGASFAGARSMTGTSAGGFALMQETVSLAGMLELPTVFYLAMRPGPATGLPTWSGQDALRFAVHAGHGEFAKLVLAPGDAKEAFEMTRKAFELSQKYQTPVILLSDKNLAESSMSVEEMDEKWEVVPLMNVEFEPEQPEGEMFHRYQPTPNGVSPRTLPGVVNGYYVANSDEHEATGLVDESVEVRNMMLERRINKMETLEGEMTMPVLYGPSEARVTLVCWGSTKGEVMEALKQLPGVNMIHFSWIWPMASGVKDMLIGRRLVFVEHNMTGQFEGLVAEKTGVRPEESLRKDDGRPFFAEEIIKFLDDNGFI